MQPEALRACLAAAGVELPVAACVRLAAYVELLMRWNRAYNLTAARTEEALVERHLLDSLVIRGYLQPGTLLDVGSGAGLPGLALALAEPERPVTLLDCNGKKTRFLRQCCSEFGLSQVRVQQARMEGLAVETGYAVVTARAVAALSELLPATRHLLAPGGVLLALKGERVAEELQALPTQEAAALEVHELPKAAGRGRAQLVVYRAPVQR
ncbi:MAG: 16S rRNA (guanine(527)-N(7))-methyltransferase RsmG [Halorhodospira sp.]